MYVCEGYPIFFKNIQNQSSANPAQISRCGPSPQEDITKPPGKTTVYWCRIPEVRYNHKRGILVSRYRSTAARHRRDIYPTAGRDNYNA